MFFSFPLSGWLWKHHGMMRPANDWWIPVIFEISYTDWCVCDARSRLNMRSLTRIHLCRMHSSWSHASWTGVLSILTASANFAHFNSYLETLSVTSLHSSFVHLFCKKQLTERNCTIKLFFVYFKQIQILIRILYYLLNSILQTQPGCVKICHFCYPEKLQGDGKLCMLSEAEIIRILRARNHDNLFWFL